MNFLQIGTNIANDDFSRIVKSYNKSDITNLVLVELIVSCNESINRCYDGYDFIIENVVINTNEDKKIKL